MLPLPLHAPVIEALTGDVGPLERLDSLDKAFVRAYLRVLVEYLQEPEDSAPSGTVKITTPEFTEE